MLLKNMKDDYGFKWIDLFKSKRKQPEYSWYTNCTSCISLEKECHHEYRS